MAFFSGGVIAAMNKITEDRRKQHDMDTSVKLSIKSETDIRIYMDSEDIRLKYSIDTPHDWARAAWALIKACEDANQTEALKNLLKADPCGLMPEKSDIGENE